MDRNRNQINQIVIKHLYSATSIGGPPDPASVFTDKFCYRRRMTWVYMHTARDDERGTVVSDEHATLAPAKCSRVRVGTSILGMRLSSQPTLDSVLYIDA